MEHDLVTELCNYVMVLLWTLVHESCHIEKYQERVVLQDISARFGFPEP